MYLKYKLKSFQSDFVDAFRMDCSKEDLKTNPDVKRLAKIINRQGKRIDKMIWLYKKIMCEN